VLDLLDAAVGVFREPVGGLDTMLERVETELTALGSRAADDDELWERKLAEIAGRVAAARAEVSRGHDPLLDRRSCDLAAVEALSDRGARRLGVRPGADPGATLGAVAEHLERRLENVTIEAARRVGIVPDVEVDVLPGEVAFHVGPELKIDALAGFDLSRDRTVRGSFRRNVAVAHEEHDSFATGHPLVEALFGFVRDGELGRTTVVRNAGRGKRGVAIDARYLVVLPEAADLAQGARVPSRRAARHLEDALVRVVVRIDARGELSVDEELAAVVDPGRSEAVPAPEGGPPPAFVAAIERGLGRAEAEAQKRLRRLVADAKEGLEREKEASQKRLARWLAQSGTKAKERDRILAGEAALHEAVRSALDGARLELDQAAVAQLV